MAEAKLGMSLDDIISSSKGKGRGDQRGGKQRRPRKDKRAPLSVDLNNAPANQTRPANNKKGGRKNVNPQLARQQPRRQPVPMQQQQQQQRQQSGPRRNMKAFRNKGGPNFGNNAARAPILVQQPTPNLGVRRKQILKKQGVRQFNQPPRVRQPFPAPIFAGNQPRQIQQRQMSGYPSAYPPVNDVRWQAVNPMYVEQAAAPKASDLRYASKLLVKNLAPIVTEEDLKELFDSVGHVQKLRLFYDRNGNSIGEAEVVYEKKGDAFAAFERYSNLALDGRGLIIELVPDAPVLNTLTSGIRVSSTTAVAPEMPQPMLRNIPVPMQYSL